MRRRFFVESFEENRAELAGEAARHLAGVLRAKPGQLYELSDGRAVWLARVERVGRGAVEFSLVEPLAAREPRLRVFLLLSVIKFARFEWCLEKAAELAAAGIAPLAAARSEAALCRAAPTRAPRWQKILREAAQQARRLRPPTLFPLVRAPQAFTDPALFAPGNGAASGALRILLSERPEASPLREILSARTAAGAAAAPTAPAGAIILAIGPEGGWTDEEIARARGAGFAEASLGGEILRAETAVIAALAILHYALGGEPRLV